MPIAKAPNLDSRPTASRVNIFLNSLVLDVFSMISRDQLDIRQHAAQRMLERNISVADVLVVPQQRRDY